MELPKKIVSGSWNYGHCQGIALDRANGWMYFSFTTALVKTDLAGRFLGSVVGLTGHLGCIAFCPEDGCVYGSLEYKNDAIGQGILRHMGLERQAPTGFYMAIFEGGRIDRPEMDAAGDGVMRAAWLRDVTEDYCAEVPLAAGGTASHRFGCSGIDGTAIGPMFGAERGSRPYLFVAYGIYGDTARQDNDCQVLLAYEMESLRRTAMPLSQENMHTSGPERPARKLFAHTGNTVYGIQNLEYDPHAHVYYAAVYTGKKAAWPNLPLYAFDAAVAPKTGPVPGVCPPMEGELLTLARGSAGGAGGVTGWHFPRGATGLIALGDGEYYLSCEGRDEQGWNSAVRLYRAERGVPFTPAEELTVVPEGENRFLALLEGEEVGRAELADGDGDALRLADLRIAEEWRAQGLGRRFLRQVTGLLGRKGARRVTADLPAGNEAARRLFRGEGFALSTPGTAADTLRAVLELG